VATLVLTERGGQTTLTLTMLYPTQVARDGAIRSGMEHGAAARYNQGDQLLQATPNGAPAIEPRSSIDLAPLRESPAMTAKAKTFDEYLANLSAQQRAALERLRKAVHAAAPQAEECISYGLAAFRLQGKPLVALGATAGHCAFYPLSSSTVASHQQELQRYDTSKGTIRFQPGDPLPIALVRKLVKARVAEIAAHVRAPN
jgi:uncharacterized protein YdhG (YjbR/CyaY superfamily)